ncbi:MAG TPA: endo-1,4-beta-xylanase [Stellaceae bacterium]|jgi:endo-1,4-beta-xylanase|nr:endo-1,4-beta-xylanase [Stellaceae bacterium]
MALGDDAPTRRRVIAGLAALAVAATTGRPAGAAAGREALRTTAAAHGLLYGSTIATDQVLADDDFTALVRRECAALVTENELKWGNICDAPGKYDFAPADAIVDFATANGIAMRGHTLLWYYRTPRWFRELSNAAIAEQEVLRHIAAVAGRYRGRMVLWDVVNEPFEPAHGRADGLRGAIFVDKVGPHYLDLAFHAARQADPTARLLLNEYGIEYDSPADDTKRRVILQHLERLRRDGVPVELLGIQGHLEIGMKPFSAKKLRDFIAEVAGMGIELAITELDVVDAAAPGDIARRDRMVADEYRRFLDVMLDEPAVRTVFTWGLSDRHSWLVRRESGENTWRTDGLPPRPLPFDAALAPKPAWTILAGCLAGAARHG